MEIFNIFSVSEPFETGAAGSGLGVPYTIQYNMSVMGTELDGTRYIRNYGKGGNSFNAEAFASNFIYLNGKSVPYPTLHDLGSDTLNTTAPTESNGDEVTTFTSQTDNSFDLAVTTIGTSTSRPRVTTNNIDTADGKIVLLSFDIVVNSGNCSIFNVIAYGHANEEIGTTLTTGHYDFEIPITGTLTNSQFYFDGTALFDISVTNWTVKEITLPTASYFSIFDFTTLTLKRFSSTVDYGDGLLTVSTIRSVTDSHQFVFNHTSPLSADDKAAIEADPNLAFRMFLDGEVLPSGFSNTDVGWFSGGNEGLASAEKVYDLSDQAFLTYVSIVDYDAATKTTLANQSNGASNLKLIRNVSGGTTGIAADNTTQWEADGRTAVTNWTITAPFTIGEVIDGIPYLFTSDGNRYKNLIADGTYTLPTGIWTLDEFGFDGVTPVAVRGVTGMIDEVVIP